MINAIKNLIRFILAPVTDDWRGGLSLVRLTFISIMYGVYQNIVKNEGIDWSILIIILFILIYLCFKGKAPELIGKLLDKTSDFKSDALKSITKKVGTNAPTSDKQDTSES